ncbi:MAG: hypothetical protein AAF633_20355 [Chloroflexota bacterium]
MTFTLTDFFIGFFLMNAMPHLIFGLFRIRMLSLFGFSPQANLAYFLVNLTVASGLFQFKYGLQSISGQGVILGACTILFIYVLTGLYFYILFRQNS